MVEEETRIDSFKIKPDRIAPFISPDVPACHVEVVYGELVCIVAPCVGADDVEDSLMTPNCGREQTECSEPISIWTQGDPISPRFRKVDLTRPVDCVAFEC